MLLRWTLSGQSWWTSIWTGQMSWMWMPWATRTVTAPFAASCSTSSRLASTQVLIRHTIGFSDTLACAWLVLWQASMHSGAHLDPTHHQGVHCHCSLATAPSAASCSTLSRPTCTQVLTPVPHLVRILNSSIVRFLRSTLVMSGLMLPHERFQQPVEVCSPVDAPKNSIGMLKSLISSGQ